MNQRIYLSCFSLLVCSVVLAQKNFSVSGKVTDAQSKPLQNVTVHLLNTGVAAVTNKDGNFSIGNLRAGTYTIEISAVGYAVIDKEIDVKENASFNFQLRETVNQLDDIIVTSQKKEEALQKVPVSISSISARQVQEYRLWSDKDLSGIVPNLNSNNSGDERNVTSIRGITTTSYDPAVTTYVDGVNQFSLDTYIPQLFDVERIEVLRGPQGTLYGRNAMGGVINIITKQPTNATTGYVELNVGNHKQQRYTAAFRAPLIKDKLFFGAAVMYNGRDGFYTNTFNNSSFDKQHGIAGNYYLKYIPVADWSVTLNVKHLNVRNDGAFPLTYDVEQSFADPYKLDQNAVGQMSDNTLNASLLVSHNGNAFNFTSQTSWQNNYRFYKSPVDGDFSPLDAVTINNNYGRDWNNVKVITEEVRFTSPAQSASALKWTAGSYFFHQTNPVKQATNFGNDAELIGVPDNNFSTISTSKGNNTGIAFYGQINYAVSKKVELIAGLRYDYENKKLFVHGDYEKEGIGTVVTQPDTTGKANFSAVSPKLGINISASKTTNVFATYSRGYRTGGLTQLSSDPSQPPLYPYKPEYSNNIEAGIKNNLLDNHLRLNITAFYTIVTDAQVPTLVLPDAITVTKNTGKLNSKGAELELNALPVKGFELVYNFGLTDAKYKSLKVSQNGEAVDLEGKKQIYTPAQTSMLAAQYSYIFNHKSQLKIVARCEWFYYGETYFDLANTIRQSPYQLLNARVGISSKYVDVFFWGRNLTDKKYIAYAYDFGALHLADPRTYGVTVTAKF